VSCFPLSASVGARSRVFSFGRAGESFFFFVWLESLVFAVEVLVFGGISGLVGHEKCRRRAWRVESRGFAPPNAGAGDAYFLLPGSLFRYLPLSF